MSAPLEPILRDLERELGLFPLKMVRELPSDHQVADATQKYILQGSPSTRFILIVSNSLSSLMVRRSVERARMARELLYPDTRDVIELPLIEGEYEERAYALWTARKPLSANRVLFQIQKRLIYSSICHWINNVAAQTLRSGNSAQLVSYIDRLISVPSLPEYIKAAAAESRLGFLTGEVAPLNVLQHGDLWIGNILRVPTRKGFIVIDWSGAIANGLPFFDLLKFSCSIGATPRQLLRNIRSYSDCIKCNVANAIPYVLAGLGRLHLELEYFPEDRFIALCRQKISALQSAL